MRKETNSPLSETAEVPITSVHMNNSEDEQSPTSETQVPTDSVSVDITENEQSPSETAEVPTTTV